MSGEWAKKQNQFNKYIKEYVDPLSTSNVQKSDSTSVSKSYLGNQIDPRTIMSKKEKYNRNIGQEMINFNNSLIKQKELIPKILEQRNANPLITKYHGKWDWNDQVGGIEAELKPGQKYPDFEWSSF